MDLMQPPNDIHYDYSFRRHLNLSEVADTLILAVIGAESLHGRAQVKLDGWWKMDRRRRRCTINASTQVGQDIACLFTGFLMKEFGEATFTVQHEVWTDA